MRHLDLFSGIGGFALAGHWAWGQAHEIVSFCEIDPWCRKLLKHHFPDVPVAEDVRVLQGDQFESVDIISGGFPCQPFSCAGRRSGTADDRHLWPQMLRLIRETKPRWVLGENVVGIASMGLETVSARVESRIRRRNEDFDDYEAVFTRKERMLLASICDDLEQSGYGVQSFNIPACGDWAPHKRERVWIVGRRLEDVGDTIGQRLQGIDRRSATQIATDGREAIPDASSQRLQRLQTCGKQKPKAHGGSAVSLWSSGNRGQWSPEPDVCRVANGIPDRVDRIKGLGNAIVPHVAMMFFEAMTETDKFYGNSLYFNK